MINNKFYSLYGEKDELSQKEKKASNYLIKHGRIIEIPELRMIVYTRSKKSDEEIKQKYLSASLTKYQNYRSCKDE